MMAKLRVAASRTPLGRAGFGRLAEGAGGGPQEIGEARGEGAGDRNDDKAPTGLQDEFVGNVLLGAQGQDRHRQSQRDQGAAERIGDGRCQPSPRAVAGCGDRTGHGVQTFSTSGLPSRPEGKNTRVTARMEKVATSL